MDSIPSPPLSDDVIGLRRRRVTGTKRLSKKRLFRHAGHNIVSVSVPDRHRKYMADLYTTLIDIQWRWNIFIFVAVFTCTWLVFGCIYFLFASLHGDVMSDVTGTAPASNGSAPATVCLENVYSFTTAYLFSIETMTTIGYGFRYPNEDCPGVYLTVILQSVIGAALQVALASVVVSKTRKAKRRMLTVLFSDHVCIHEVEQHLQLSVRLGDMRDSHVAGASARGFLVKKFKVGDGSFVPVRSYQLNFQSENGRDELFLPWPSTILHTVDDKSPLWSISRDELLSGQYELIVVITATCVTTSTPFQARKSYHTTEMLWGRKFTNLGLQFNNSGTYDLDLSTFHSTVPASTVLCSAQDISQLRHNYSLNHPDWADPSVKQSQRMECNVSVDPRRSQSVEEPAASGQSEPHQRKERRYSLGDLISSNKGKEPITKCPINALNMYRHRLSVTDTYLGSDTVLETMEEDEEENEAVLSVVSTRSMEKRTDVRDVFKRRKSSVTQLFFTQDTSNNIEEIHIDSETHM